eukprot:COSAG02_NODE_59136_length_275_cov_0.590909_1_plen_31_part_01
MAADISALVAQVWAVRIWHELLHHERVAYLI